MEKNYNFEWNHLGDINLGRPNLGNMTPVAVYRLMQYTLRAVLEKNYGLEKTQQLLKEAGFLAGTEFCKNRLDITLPIISFMAQLN